MNALKIVTLLFLFLLFSLSAFAKISTSYVAVGKDLYMAYQSDGVILSSICKKKNCIAKSMITKHGKKISISSCLKKMNGKVFFGKINSGEQKNFCHFADNSFVSLYRMTGDLK